MPENIGIQTQKPGNNCQDKLCPFHGSLRVRGRVFTGEVVSDKMHKTVTVQWERRHFIPKYERYEKRRSRVKAHNPLCLNVKVGDIVKIAETRPLSKTKNFVVVEKLTSIVKIVAEDVGEQQKEKQPKKQRRKNKNE